MDISKWRAVTDQTTGRVYYYHYETRETSWVKPPSMIEQEKKLEGGKGPLGLFDKGSSNPSSPKAGALDLIVTIPVSSTKLNEYPTSPDNRTPVTSLRADIHLENANSLYLPSSRLDIPKDFDNTGGVWSEVVDDVTGLTFFTNENGSSEWIMPRNEWKKSINTIKPFNNEMDATTSPHRDNQSNEDKVEGKWAVKLHFESGCIYYEDLLNGVSSWENPDSLFKVMQVNTKVLDDIKLGNDDELIGYNEAPQSINFASSECEYAKEEIQNWIESTNVAIPKDILENRIHFPSYMTRTVPEKILLGLPKTFIVMVFSASILDGKENSIEKLNILFNPMSTVKDVIERALSKLKAKGYKVDPEIKCVLKITGYEDYLIDYNKSICSYENVLRVLRGFNDQTSVKLTLVKVSDQKFEAITRRVEYDNKNFNEAVNIQDNHLFDFENKIPRPIQQNIEKGGKHLWRQTPFVYQKELSSDVLFHVKVRAATNIVIPDGVTELFVKVGLFYCDEYLRDNLGEIELSTAYPDNSHRKNPPGETKPFYTPASEDPIFSNTWLNSSIPVKNLPIKTRLSFVLFGRDKTKDEKYQLNPIAYVCLRAFDHLLQLISGRVSLRMFPWTNQLKNKEHKEAAPLPFISSGPIVQNAADDATILHVEFDSYCVPVFGQQDQLSALPLLASRPDSYKIEKPSDVEKETLTHILNSDPLTNFSYTEMRIVWKYRDYVVKNSEGYGKGSLSKLIASVNWASPSEIKLMHSYLTLWAPISPNSALQLLGSKVSDPIIRLFAVQTIATMPDNIFVEFLLQLVQALKLESYHDSPLSRLLIKRAISNPYRIGHSFFWLLHSEMHDKFVCERFGVIIEIYLRNCGSHRIALKKQYRVNEILRNITDKARREKIKSNRTPLAKNLLHKVVSQFPSSFELCISSRLACRGVIVEECKVMDSKMAPLWITLENIDPDGEKIPIIFKSGDDLRQDLMTLQLIRIMDQIWMENGLDLRLRPYACTGTGDEVGMIEIVTEADTTARIMGKSYGVRGAFALSPIDDWLKEEGKYSYTQCVDNFIRSCAGYCVATYLLGIGDRHPSNIMVTRAGELFHIDFGHFLGNFKSKYGMKRERAPFVFTPQMLQVMGGVSDEKFLQFKHYCCDGFNQLRKHGNLFIVLFQLMIPAGMPELRQSSDIDYLAQMLQLDLSNEDADVVFEKEVHNSLNTASRQVDNMIHIFAHQ